MSDTKNTTAQPVTIYDTLWGYAKPVLTAAITRGLLGVSMFLIGHGLPGVPTNDAAAAGVLAGIVAVGTWAWGPIKSYIDHKMKVHLADAAPNKVARVVTSAPK